MKVEIWSDVVCPWCYVGKRHLEQALERFAHADEVEIEWKSYELDPDAPAQRPGSYTERLSAKYGISVGEARARMARIVSVGANAGIDFRFDDARPGNTFDAHRLLHLAASVGLQDELKERLLAATFTEGHPIGSRDTLVKLAADVGIAEVDARRALEGGEYADDVRADEREAMAIGVRGVPFFVIDRRYAVSGAQPPELLLQALERAWSEANPLEVMGDAGDACEGDACDL
jgi:predicted DsbA family dithiol-disulfide isomerase